MSFRLGVLTDEISDDLQEAIDFAGHWGIDEIELHSVWGRNICDLDDASLSRALRIVRASGMKVTCIDSLTLRCPLSDDAEYAAHLAHFRRSIEIARLFETDIVRLFSFWREPELSEEDWERIVDRLTLPIRIAETEGVRIGFENVSSGNIGTSEDVERLFERFPSPNLGLIWDPANAYAAGDPRSAVEGYRRVRERVIHVHVKDAAFVDGTREWRIIGEGDVEYVPFLRALHEDGYTGVIALETHYRPPNGDRVAASAESLVGLRNAMREALSE